MAGTPDENYLMSPHGTPHSQRFDTANYDGMNGQQQDHVMMPFDQYGSPVNVLVKKNQAGFQSSVGHSSDFELYAPDSALSTPTYVNYHENPMSHGWVSDGDDPRSRRSSRRISNGIMERVARFESLAGGMGIEGAQTPMTPPNQNVHGTLAAMLRDRKQTALTCRPSGYFPPTPMETPHEGMLKRGAQLSRFTGDYDESMEETIKPVRKSNNRSSGIFEDMRQAAEGGAMATPARANTMPMSRSFEHSSMQGQEYMNMNGMDAQYSEVPNVFNNGNGHQQAMGHVMQQFHGAGGAPAMGYVSSFLNKPDLRPIDTMVAAGTAIGSPSPRGGRGSRSPHRRTESLASIVSAASIASINIEETRMETGITQDDISQYIQGPDPSDGKWICTFEECLKRFGRKENIKSHVQTHLNDRQYRCPTCRKCFVRQHDLKRHAKIHTGIKPYPCDCGNSFARHDALTRHRQRGMCIGAFDGIVRKVAKRGRPRKHRPEMDERVSKAARTRIRNAKAQKENETGDSGDAANAGAESAYETQSGCSDSSSPNSPNVGEIDEDLDMLDEKPFADMMDAALHGAGESIATARGAEHAEDTAAGGPATMDPNSFLSDAPPGTANQPEEIITTVNPAATISDHGSVHDAANSPGAMSHASFASHHSHHSHHSQQSHHSRVSTPAVKAESGLPPSQFNSPVMRSDDKHAVHSNNHSPCTTPPDLSHSTSPPPLHRSNFPDFGAAGAGPVAMGNANTSGSSDDSRLLQLRNAVAATTVAELVGNISALSTDSGPMGGISMSGMGHHVGAADDTEDDEDADMLLKAFTHDSSLMTLDSRDTSGMLMLPVTTGSGHPAKFDEDEFNPVDMFDVEQGDEEILFGMN